MVESRLVEEISESRGEPRWMRERRLRAWHIYQGSRIPPGGEEAWRRTDVGLFELQDEDLYYEPQSGLTASEIEQIRALALRNGYPSYGGELIQRDCEARAVEPYGAASRQGIIITDLGTALTEYPSLVQEYFMTRCLRPERSKFDALHGALWSGGVLIYIPEGIELSLPLHTLFYLDREKLALFPHLLVILEEGSKATLFAEWRSRDLQTRALCFPAIEVLVGEGAVLNYFGLQDWGSSILNLSTRRVIAEKESSLLWVEGMLGSRLSKENLEIILNGPGAQLSLAGAFLTSDSQHLDISPLVHHIAPHTRGDVLINGALRGRSRAIFHGMVKIEKSAPFTDACLSNHNLLLSPGARADSIPKLEIECDEVRASHGVTVGEIDRELLFYLMSRGLDESGAQNMVVQGFYEAVLQRIPQEGMRKLLGSTIRGKSGL